jgi:hypothetical protein
MSEKDEARERLTLVLSHLHAGARLAVKRAGNDARAELAIVAQKPDGSGHVGLSLEFDGFISDLQTLLGVAPPSDEEIEIAPLLVGLQTGVIPREMIGGGTESAEAGEEGTGQLPREESKR